MTEPDADYLRKIGALLSKAEGTDNEHESEAFFAKAHELMIRHAIDEQQVRAAGAARLKTETPVKVTLMYSPHHEGAVGKRTLLAHVAIACHCQFFSFGGDNWHRAGGRYARWGVLVGFASDIETAQMLYASLLIQAARFGNEAYRATGSGGKSAYLNSFTTGFGQRIGERLRENEQRVVAQVPNSSALMVVRTAEVAEAVARMFPNTRKSYDHSSGNGRRAGRLAADRADIGSTRIGARAQIGGGS